LSSLDLINYLNSKYLVNTRIIDDRLNNETIVRVEDRTNGTIPDILCIKVSNYLLKDSSYMLGICRELSKGIENRRTKDGRDPLSGLTSRKISESQYNNIYNDVYTYNNDALTKPIPFNSKQDTKQRKQLAKYGRY
jgi:hypothetical protein